MIAGIVTVDQRAAALRLVSHYDMLMNRWVQTMSLTTRTQRNAHTYSCHYGSTKARRNAHSVIAGTAAHPRRHHNTHAGAITRASRLTQTWQNCADSLKNTRARGHACKLTQHLTQVAHLVWTGRRVVARSSSERDASDDTSSCQDDMSPRLQQQRGGYTH